MGASTYDPGTPAGRVRLLVSDVGHVSNGSPVWLFDNDEIVAFLAMGHDRTNLAAAIALETIASNSAMVLKVITSQDLSTDGAKLSDALLKRAKVLRDQDDADNLLDPTTNALDFAVSYPGPACGPELAHYGSVYP